MRIGIIFAMEEELVELKNIIDINKENSIYELTFYEGKLNNIEYVLVQSGVGKVNASRTTQILIDNYKIDYLFNIGVAGGVDDSLKVFDIVVGTKLVQHDFEITEFGYEKGYVPKVGVFIDADKYLIDIANKVPNITVKNGIIASGDIFITDTNMAKKINTKFNALCVEMEGAAIAQVAYLCNVPFLVIRSISDTPNKGENKVEYEEFLGKSCKTIALFMKEIINELN